MPTLTRSTARKAATASENAPIFRLPPELLGMIADWMMCEDYEEEYKEDKYNLARVLGARKLGSLRLAHRRFAYLQPLLAKMFECVKMTPGKRKVDLDWTSCGRFAKTMVFDDGCEDWMLERRGVPADQYVWSGRARRAIVRALKQFRNLRSFKYPMEPLEPDHRHQATKCFATAMACMREANIKPASLTIQYSRRKMDDDGQVPQWGPDMTGLSSWRGLAFTRLEELRITSDGDFGGNDGCDSMLPVLQECSTTLRILQIESTGELLPEQSSTAIPPMPNLESIDLKYSEVPWKAIAIWISQCPKLQRLSLEEVWLGGTGGGRRISSHLWPILHAIRMHQSRIVYNFAEIIILHPFVGKGCAFSITNDGSVYPGFDVEDLIIARHARPAMENAVKMIKDYIAGDGDWSPLADAPNW